MRPVPILRLCLVMERLQKVLAQAGIASRRACEKLIAEGAIMVNGQSVTEPGMMVDPETAAIKLHGKRIKVAPDSQVYHYLALYKPKGYLTTMQPDEEGRPTILNLFERIKTRVYPVGRLDFNSEGLVLLTNDGELAHRLTHPKFKVPRMYEVKVHGVPSERVLHRLAHGVMLEDGKTRPALVKILRVTGNNTWLLFTIYEGKKRQIRRMCEHVRLPVSKLKRIAIGPITLKGLERGNFRVLSSEEIQKLKKAVSLQ